MKLILFITYIWNKKKLTLIELVFFYILCVGEFFYKIAFWIHKKYNAICVSQVRSKYFVISVGNVTVGGTGKTVIARFIIENLSEFQGAILSRGYAGSYSSPRILIPSNGPAEDEGAVLKEVGDEPYMLSKVLNCPIIVGRNRAQSALFLEKYCSSKAFDCTFLVLDDGYQHWSLFKDFEILLIDARNPYGNGHCLPAGPLREKNLKNASILILTHANEVKPGEMQQIKKDLSLNQPHFKVFSGKYELNNFFDTLHSYSLEVMQNKKFIAVAGVGSFGGFLKTLEMYSLQILNTLEFEDHHAYTYNELILLYNRMKSYNADGIITTYKDWNKLIVLCNHFFPEERPFIYCIDVKFSFLSALQHELFISTLKSAIVQKGR